MADGIHFYANGIGHFSTQNEFAQHRVGLYEADTAAPAAASIPTEEGFQPGRSPRQSAQNYERHTLESGANPPYNQMGNDIEINQIGKRHQIYIGNLTWWTTDQDITDAITGVGITDFVGVKFFANRASGQSKGFCSVTLGSESSVKMCMERLPKKLLQGQYPVVTFPTRHAQSQFEAQSKTRPPPPSVTSPRNPSPQQQLSRPTMGPPQGVRPKSAAAAAGMPPPSPDQGMCGPPMGRGGPPNQRYPLGLPDQANQMSQPTGFQNGSWNIPGPNGPPCRGPHPQGPQQQAAVMHSPICMTFQSPPSAQGPPQGPSPRNMRPDAYGQSLHRDQWSLTPNPGVPHHRPGGPGLPSLNQPPPIQGTHPWQSPPSQMGGLGRDGSDMRSWWTPPSHGSSPVHGGPPQESPVPYANPTIFQHVGGLSFQGQPIRDQASHVATGYLHQQLNPDMDQPFLGIGLMIPKPSVAWSTNS